MKTKVSLIKMITFIGFLIVAQSVVLAQVDPAFKSLVNSVKAKTINKASKIINLQFAPPVDPNYVENSRYCRGTSSSTPTTTASGLLTCQAGYKYSIKANKYIYTYSSSASDAKLSLVTLISQGSYPISYYNYSYPDGSLRSVVVKLSKDKMMLFEPNGSLKKFSSPKNCISERNGAFSNFSYTHDMCNKIMVQEEHSLNFGNR